MTRVSIVIPAYNEEGNLELLYARLCEVSAQLDDVELEFLFVDDASTDRTPDLLQTFANNDSRVRLIRFARNFGSHIAYLAGITHAKGDAMIIMSADLQDPPELIPSLIDRWREGYEIVWAVRESREDPLRNVLQARLFYWLFRKIAISDFPEQGSDVVLISSKVAKYIVKSREKNTSFFGLIAWMGLRQSQIPYTRSERHSGETKWTFSKTIKHAVDAFISFSYTPIRWASYLGMGFILMGAMLLGILLGLMLIYEQSISGWLWILGAVCIIGGIQTIVIGILGEYVWRILDQSRHRPMYILEKEDAAPVNEEP